MSFWLLRSPMGHVGGYTLPDGWLMRLGMGCMGCKGEGRESMYGQGRGRVTRREGRWNMGVRWRSELTSVTRRSNVLVMCLARLAEDSWLGGSLVMMISYSLMPLSSVC